MTFEDRVKRLKLFQPDARDIRNAGICPTCNYEGMLFYDLEEFPAEEVNIGDDVSMAGGFFCPDCGFGNAGAMPLADWNTATIALPEMTFDDD